MALTPTQKSLCNKVVSDYYTLVSPVKSAKSTINSKRSQLDSSLRQIRFSTPANITGALGDLQDYVTSITPDLDAVDELGDFISQCEYLSDIAPASTVNGTQNSIFDNINSFLGDLASSFPEFGAGELASGINDLLNGISIPGSQRLSDLLKKADKLLNCLSGLCAASDSSYTGQLSSISSDLQGLYDDLNIVDDPLSDEYGNFNYDAFYNSIGLSSADKDIMNTVVTGIDSQKSVAKTSVDDTVAAVKNFTKTFGGLF